MLKYLLCVALFLISYLTDAQCYYPYIQNYNPEYCASSDEIKIHSSGYSSGTFTSSGSGSFFPSTGYAPIVVYKLTAEDKIKGFVKISLTVNDGNYYCKLDTATFIMAPILHLDAGPSEISVCSDTVLTATTNTSNRNVFWYWESGYSSGKDHCQFIAVNKELEQGHSILYASVSNACSQARDSIKINLKASTFTFVPPLPQCPETTVPLSASGNYSNIKWYSHHGSFPTGDSTSVVNFKSFKESSNMSKQYLNVVYSNSKCQSISIVSIDQLLKTESIITIHDTVYCKAVTAISVYGNTYNPKTGYRSHSWTSLGSGIFHDNYGEIQYIPSEQDLIKEKVTLVLTPDADVCSVVSDSINIYFKDVKVNAGKDTTVFCNSFGLKGTVENGSVGFWYAEDNYNTNHNTTRNNNEFSTAFFVSKVDVERGSKKYILEGRKNYSSSCEPVRDTMTVFYKTPVYYASIEPVLCSKEEVKLNGSAINATSGVWITTGTGSFTDPFSMNTIYKPSLGDIQSGGVDFILKDPNDCGFEIRKFARLESNVPRVGYFATTGTSFCKGSEINVVYAAGHNMEHNLYSTGTGTLVGDGFSYKYTPTESDFEKGKTEFILSSTAEGYCPGSDTLAIQLINQPGPSLTAGPDQYIKPGNSILLNGTYSDNGDVYWYSNGSGYFYNSNSLSTTYIPSAEDLRKESLLFTITNYPYSPCGFYKDTMKVVFDRNNTITLGGKVYMEHTYNPLFRGRAKLFRAENSGYTLVQSIDFDSAYSFVGVTEGDYIIQASQDTGYFEKLPFVPTYYGASLNWENATLISYSQGSSKTLDIMLMPMSADNSWNMGDYNIYGNINIPQNSSPNMRTTAVSKQTIVYLKNESGQILTYTVAEDNFYYFYQLVSGNYTLDFEYPGMNADPASIVLQGDPNIYTEVNTTLLPSTILGGIQKQTLNTVAIYPNPISDKLILNFNSTRNNLKISLIKMDGTVMMEEKIAGPITSLQLNLYDQKQGFYLLKIEDAISSETYKVMKQ